VTFVIHLSTLSVIGYFFLAVAVFAAVIEIWALVDALSRPTQAFVAVGKQTKKLWLLILGVATVVGVGYAFYVGSIAVLSFLPIAAFVAAGVYLTDVRPKVKDFKSGGGGTTHMGPYGPW
jgi:predicted histidine transporter YuiF (NhaC family)